MTKIIILINDIDPNIYVDNIDTKFFDTTVIYQRPVSNAMEFKFKICIEKYPLYKWVIVEEKEDLLPKAKIVASDGGFSTIISFAEDMIVPTECLKKELGMKNQYSEIKDITNKFHQREIVTKAYPELSNEFYKIENSEEAKKISEFFHFPGIIKPVSMAGSRLVCKVNSKTEFLNIIKELDINDFHHTSFILESFFAGSEWYGSSNESYDDYVSVESIVSDKRITHLTVSSKPMIAKPFRETGLIVPTALSKDKQDLLFAAASKVIKALNYKNGPTHIELKLTSSGPKLIEFNPRAGGPVPYLIQTSSNYPIINQIIQSYLGETVQEFKGFQNSAAFFSFQVGNGEKVLLENINSSLVLLDDNVKEFFIFKNKGDSIDPKIGTSAMLGFAYVVGATPEDCLALRDDIWSKLEVQYSKEQEPS